MQKLGYIVSENKINNVKGFVEVVSDISQADTTKPVLIVGLKKAKEIIEKFSILEKKIGENLYWTFKKTERRVDFEKDINYFYNNIIYNITRNIKYYYINIINLKYNNIKKLYNILFSSNKKYIYINNGMIYFLHGERVFGLSLEVIEYIGVPKEKILRKLYGNKNNVICTDMSECVRNMKNEIGDKKYIVPYFLSKM